MRWMSVLHFFTEAGAIESAAWYQSLTLPFFAPPAWAFGVVWSILYPLIGLAFAWALLRWSKGTLDGRYIALFCVNLLLNAAFSPLQFGLQSITLATLDIIGILATLVYLVGASWQRARGIALLLLPYLIWVSFATILQLCIAYLNW